MILVVAAVVVSVELLYFERDVLNSAVAPSRRSASGTPSRRSPTACPGPSDRRATVAPPHCRPSASGTTRSPSSSGPPSARGSAPTNPSTLKTPGEVVSHRRDDIFICNTF
jgi:hypothetical protein